MMQRLLYGIVIGGLILLVFWFADQESDVLVLATTTSVQDSGLLDVVIPLFEKESGVQVRTIAVGSGQALELARRGEVDALLVHDPKGEEELEREGYVVNRQELMYNSLVIVGPEDDPARISESESAVEAFGKIRNRELFVSRGDDSGTHRSEVSIWLEAGGIPEEGYLLTGSGMGATLTIADQKNAYTLTDKGTFLWLERNLSLVILYEKELVNVYHVMQVNPERFSLVNGDAGASFVEFMLDPETQKLIGSYGDFGEPLFFPVKER